MTTIVTISLLALICWQSYCFADVYMHNPRGSNNRLNENTATRTTNNRIFDSQNNNRGGYNVGDRTDAPAGNNADNQYQMKYFQSGRYLVQNPPNGQSELVVEWTNQHGCGGNEDTDPHKLNCNIVIQMLCQDDSDNVAPDDGITIRDGTSTTTQDYTKIADTSTKSAFISRRNNDVRADRGLQEPWFWHDACQRRQRNKGLFTADQNLAEDEAISTRQNPDGDRSGYECPEERDYFPYWHPTPFFDVAVLAQNSSMCDYYEQNSFNRMTKFECVESFPGGNGRKHFSNHNNQVDCENAQGSWVEYHSMLELANQYTSEAECLANKDDGLTYKWGKPWDPVKINNHEEIVDTCFVAPPELHCEAAGWTRSNHLGNGREGVPLNYTAILPYFPSGKAKRCVLRIRYNISTDDYDPYKTDSNLNGENSPIRQNPLVDVGANGQALQLAINTAQTGRTFQDRSHMTKLAARPAEISDEARVLNLNVRGKRGNIVQVYPAVEYDFIPNRLTVAPSDLIHIQWTGSNTHNNNGPGGDGQTGSDGEGKAGTDRNNLLQTLMPDENFPLPLEQMTMWKDAEVVWSSSDKFISSAEYIPIMLATGGYYECIESTSCSKSVDDLPQLKPLLDNSAASFEGTVLRFTKQGQYYYICSRNNNFTNRSQKGHIIVK